MMEFFSQITVLFSVFSFLDSSTSCSFLLCSPLDLTRHCLAFTSTATSKALCFCFFFSLYFTPDSVLNTVFFLLYTLFTIPVSYTNCVTKTFNFSLDAIFHLIFCEKNFYSFPPPSVDFLLSLHALVIQPNYTLWTRL